MLSPVLGKSRVHFSAVAIHEVPLTLTPYFEVYTLNMSEGERGIDVDVAT